ncbi:hypothetical protein FGSG_13295, partial [Fusarium graminearum PH-1]|uniref:hypothetical protein n=1 Tax=Gibberella zeae (strain ATCC MYA-4620 / CBS 123657 / FGSC 9075 / NRRL 31084 / PH-1) TaxID=229533 RepID=UPI0003CB7ED9
STMPQSMFPLPPLSSRDDQEHTTVLTQTVSYSSMEIHGLCSNHITLEPSPALAFGFRSHKAPGTRCPTCALAGKEVWVIPGRACGYCGTPCVD